MSMLEQALDDGHTSENDAAAGNSRLAEASTSTSQPGTKANSQYRLNRLSLKKKSSNRVHISANAALTLPASHIPAPTPLPGTADTGSTQQPDSSVQPCPDSGNSTSGAASQGGRDMSGLKDAPPSMSGRAAGQQGSLLRRPAISVGARFKPPGLLSQAATGYSGIPVPPPGWKPRKKDLASFDMLDDLPDLAAIAAPPASGGAAAAGAPAAAGADGGNADAADAPPEAKPSGAGKRQWRPFVPPRAMQRTDTAAGVGSSDVSAAPNSDVARAAVGNRLGSKQAEDRGGGGLEDSDEAAWRPNRIEESLAEPPSKGRHADKHANGVSAAWEDNLGIDESDHGTNLHSAPHQQQQQQQQGRLQLSADAHPDRLRGTAGASETPLRFPMGQRASGGRAAGRESGRFDTVGNAELPLGWGRSLMSGIEQAAGSSTQRRRQLKRLYSDNPKDDPLLRDSAITTAAALDEDDGDLLEDLGIMNDKSATAAKASSGRLEIGSGSHSSAAEAAILIPEPRLSFASRLSRATRTQQPTCPSFDEGSVLDADEPFATDTYPEAQPEDYGLPDIDEQPEEAGMSPSRQQQSGAHQTSEDRHGSARQPGSPAEEDFDSGGDGAPDAAPGRRAFKRLRKMSGAPIVPSDEAGASASRGLADWSDDEDAGERRRRAEEGHSPQQNMEQAPRGTNPFARATKRRAQEPTLAFHALPAAPAKSAADHLSAKDIRSVLLAPPPSRQERSGGANKAASAASACEEIIDLASDSSDDGDKPAVRNAHAAEQSRQQPARRRGVLQLPPAPAVLTAQGYQSGAFTPACKAPRQGAARKPGDRSYLGAYSAADIAEGRFSVAAPQPPAATAQPPPAAASEAARDDLWKGKEPIVEADDYEAGYGGGYDDDVAGPSDEWGGGGAGYDGDAQQEEWEDWGDPGEEAGPSHASPQRWQPQQEQQQDWQQLRGGWDADPDAGPWGAAAAQGAGTNGAGGGEPWWRRLEDFVPVGAMRGGRDPRDGSLVHIDYRAQFSGAPAAPGQERARGGRGREASGGANRGRERDEAPGGSGHWITEYQRRGPVKVYVTATGRRLTGPAAYKASQKDSPGAAVPQEAKAKRQSKSGGRRSFKAKRRR